MSLSRRSFLHAGTAAGALLLARPLGALATTLGPSAEFSTARVSRLFPGTLVHADLHNHSVLSDGDGDPNLAFASMRDAGLDVAALTDHASADKLTPHAPCEGDACSGALGINEQSWQTIGRIADAANSDGQFAAIRGFEWSSPTLGHVNVWFSQTWTDPSATAGTSAGEGAGQYANPIPGVGTGLDTALRANPQRGLGMAAFYEWLGADPARPVLGGGLGAIAGFNHPGREPGRYGYFGQITPATRERLVSIEVFNRREDYLFEGIDAGQPSPIVECLDAGWRTGLLGVTDEHGTDWGVPDGKGRTGLWVTDQTRMGVKEALQSRRFFATNQRGLRVDASANGVRMGGSVQHRTGPVTFQLDVDRGDAWTGKPLVVQVLQTGRPLPTVLASVDVVVPAGTQPVLSFTTPVDIANGTWVVLRIADPSVAADGRAPQPWKAAGQAVAYTAPFFLQP